jgi:xylose isomerase
MAAPEEHWYRTASKSVSQSRGCRRAGANLRVAFNQVRALERNGYGKNGEFVCFDVHPFRTTKPEHWLAHLDNSRRTFLKLVKKARSFDEKNARQLIADRNYAELDQVVLEHLMGD